jgi:hypothetical protein
MGLGATAIQALVRGVAGRTRAFAYRAQRKQNRAVIHIQRLTRGALGRLRARSIQESKIQDAAATVIQMYARRRLAIMLADVLRGYKKRRAGIEDAAVRKIQRTYRGHRGRLWFRMALLHHRVHMRKLAAAATKIQRIARGRLGRQQAQQMRTKQFQERVANAKCIQEMWAEDTHQWFYYNHNTEEATWEPPATGYTKADGRLVLCTGLTIEDPAVVAEEEAQKRQADRICVECAKRVAIRNCLQCGDKFCTKCYRATHLGARAEHVWDALGPIECAECEEELAVRWCVSCDEAFCDSCWRKVHTRYIVHECVCAHVDNHRSGKRKFHPFCEVDEGGRVSSKMFTIDGQEVYRYDPTYAHQRYSAEPDAVGVSTVAEDPAYASAHFQCDKTCM